MPTDDQSKDSAMSELLSQVDSVQSPDHLDRTILQAAKRKAEEQRELNTSVGAHWFGPDWRSAIAVFSVAAVAISVSIQIFNEESREQEFQRTVSNEAAPLQIVMEDSPDSEPAAAFESATLAADSADPATPQSASAAATGPALAELLSVVEQDRVSSNASAGSSTASRGQLERTEAATSVATTAATTPLTPASAAPPITARRSLDTTQANTATSAVSLSNVSIAPPPTEPLLDLLASVLFYDFDTDEAQELNAADFESAEALQSELESIYQALQNNADALTAASRRYADLRELSPELPPANLLPPSLSEAMASLR